MECRYPVAHDTLRNMQNAGFKSGSEKLNSGLNEYCI